MAFCSAGKVAEEARSAGSWYWGFRADEVLPEVKLGLQ